MKQGCCIQIEVNLVQPVHPCMLPLNTMRDIMMQMAFDLMNKKAFICLQMRVLEAAGVAKAHSGDINKLLCPAIFLGQVRCLGNGGG